MSVKTITGSALLLAIALLSQGFLRMIIPVHGLVQFLVGSIVGACYMALWIMERLCRGLCHTIDGLCPRYVDNSGICTSSSGW